MRQQKYAAKQALLRLMAITLSIVGIAYTLSATAQNGAYTLGPGDLIQIQVYGEDDLDVQTRVPGDGMLSYPFLGEFNVQGLTPHQLRNVIANGLADKYLKDPNVQVYVIEYRPVYITGEVKKPGGYPYVPGLTVHKAVSLAGGLTGLASTRNIFITREGQDAGEPEEAKLSTPVGPGDTLFIDEGFF